MTEFQKLQNQALKYLSIRARSKKEIRDYLAKKTNETELVDQIITKFEQLKLINDTAFAQWYVESRSRSRPSSAWLIARELHQKGIDKTAVSGIRSESEDDLATRALQKKFGRYKSLSWLEFRQKAGRFLASRGFQAGTIEKVLKKTYNGDNVTNEF